VAPHATQICVPAGIGIIADHLPRHPQVRPPCGRPAVRQPQHPAVAQHHFDRRSTAAFHRRSDAVACHDRYRHKTPLPATFGRQGARTGLTPPQMQQIWMDIVASRDLGNTRLAASALLNDPQLLGCRPSSPPLRTSKYRNR